MARPQGRAPFITSSGEIIWPGEQGQARGRDITLPLTTATSLARRPSGFFRKCGAALRRPLCCFPPSSVEPPTWGDEPALWFSPILGFAPVFWLLLITSTAFCLASYLIPSRVCMTIFTVFLCLVGLCFHEFAHAATAYIAGADHVPESGYLTCDLIRYMDFLDIILAALFISFGGFVIPGGRVRLDTRSVRSRGWKAAISIAGPLANLVLALVASVIVHIYTLTIATHPPPTLPLPIVAVLCFIFLQVMSCILNLVPFPPLDGWYALDPYIADRCFLKAFLANSHITERVFLMVSTVIFYVAFTYVPGVWSTFAYFAGAVSGIPSGLFLQCMHMMMNPLSPAFAGGVGAADLTRL